MSVLVVIYPNLAVWHTIDRRYLLYSSSRATIAWWIRSSFYSFTISCQTI